MSVPSGKERTDLIEKLRSNPFFQLGLDLADALEALTEAEEICHDRNHSGLSELMMNLGSHAPIWPNQWGQDVAFIAMVVYKRLREKDEKLTEAEKKIATLEDTVRRLSEPPTKPRNVADF